MSESSPKKKYPVYLPKTDFPMKADLPQREPKRVEAWKAAKVYEAVEAARKAENAAGKGRGRAVLHDGPPYANGAIHIGHALNKILKDVVVKSRWLDGFESPYVPGWDCHGLPIEHAVEKDLGPKRRELSRAQFLEKCRVFASKWIDAQRLGFQRLGVLGAWDTPYLTMDPKFEAAVVRELGKLFEHGAVTRKLKVVHWSYGARTALAEAEVEYADKTSPAIFVRFEVPQAQAKAFLEACGIRPGGAFRLFLPIWTTTPWTLPSNRAIAMHPDMEYALAFEHLGDMDQFYVVAVPLLETFNKTLGITLHTKAVLKGREFQTLAARHPWIDRDAPVLMGDHVTADTGTGLVHTAPDHGVDDFAIAHHLGLFQLVGPDGKFTAAANDPDLEGKNIFDTNSIVIEKLKAAGTLLHEDALQHSYPHCWRTKTPILFRATEQWFITMDEALTGGKSLRELGLDGVDGTRWVPAAGRNRIHAMIAGRPDWCISRQRAWGTPITVLRDKESGEPLVRPEFFARAAAVIERGGIEAWADLPVEALTEGLGLDASRYQKETDILDVWIDSGVSAGVVCDTHPELSRADYGKFIYLEGSDQHRGWFHSSLLFNLAASGEKPYTTVVTHGFVLDAKGQKMSKSLGNTVTPDDVFKTYGADILRLWTCSVDYNEDVRIGKEILERTADAYRKIRNTLRFLLGALDGFDPAKDAVPEADWTPLDRELHGAFLRLAREVREAYLAFEFHRASQALLEFCQRDLSGRWFEIIKDRLYCDGEDSARRRSARSQAHRLAEGLCILLAPMLSFTADEAWEHLPGAAAKGPVFAQRFPEAPAGRESDAWAALWAVREAVQGAMEPHRAAKAIGTSLDAAVRIGLPPETQLELHGLGEDLEDLFVVSSLEFFDAPELQIEVRPHAGAKCPRCWNHRGGHGTIEDPELCLRCAKVMAAKGQA
ncbi:MAG: isoleucine--tRNA ligase [Holophagaceae bacterium]